MSALDATNPLRPGPTGFKAWLMPRAMALLPTVFAVLRRVWPIAKFRGYVLVTRFDDVREVFNTDRAFGVVYNANLQVITGGEPFFLGLSDTPQYRAQLNAMRQVVLPADLPALGDRAETLSEAIVATSNGRVEVVALIRAVTFDLIASYFGVPPPSNGRLDVWATRLFEYQFTGTPADTALRAEVDAIAPALRAHIDAAIAQRKSTPTPQDDILARCLARQAAGEPGYSDIQIRTALLCMVVGGPPQPPMVVPQAMEQLLRRPAALQSAHQAARLNDDALLHGIVREAMRFDPLAPALPRIALTAHTIAAGTRRQTAVAPGDHIFVGFASAMMDPRRLPAPGSFDPTRLDYEYIHFGQGLHACFGRHINQATLHRMLKPLLRRPGLQRAPGGAGHLRKDGIFAANLEVTFG